MESLSLWLFDFLFFACVPFWVSLTENYCSLWLLWWQNSFNISIVLLGSTGRGLLYALWPPYNATSLYRRECSVIVAAAWKMDLEDKYLAKGAFLFFSRVFLLTDVMLILSFIVYFLSDFSTSALILFLYEVKRMIIDYRSFRVLPLVDFVLTGYDTVRR